MPRRHTLPPSPTRLHLEILEARFGPNYLPSALSFICSCLMEHTHGGDARDGCEPVNWAMARHGHGFERAGGVDGGSDQGVTSGASATGDCNW